LCIRACMSARDLKPEPLTQLVLERESGSVCRVLLQSVGTGFNQVLNAGAPRCWWRFYSGRQGEELNLNSVAANSPRCNWRFTADQQGIEAGCFYWRFWNFKRRGKHSECQPATQDQDKLNLWPATESYRSSRFHVSTMLWRNAKYETMLLKTELAGYR